MLIIVLSVDITSLDFRLKVEGFRQDGNMGNETSSFVWYLGFAKIPFLSRIWIRCSRVVSDQVR